MINWWIGNPSVYQILLIWGSTRSCRVGLFHARRRLLTLPGPISSDRRSTIVESSRSYPFLYLGRFMDEILLIALDLLTMLVSSKIIHTLLRWAQILDAETITMCVCNKQPDVLVVSLQSPRRKSTEVLLSGEDVDPSSCQLLPPSPSSFST